MTRRSTCRAVRARIMALDLAEYWRPGSSSAARETVSSRGPKFPRGSLDPWLVRRVDLASGVAEALELAFLARGGRIRALRAVVSIGLRRSPGSGSTRRGWLLAVEVGTCQRGRGQTAEVTPMGCSVPSARRALFYVAEQTRDAGPVARPGRWRPARNRRFSSLLRLSPSMSQGVRLVSGELPPAVSRGFHFRRLCRWVPA